MKTEILVNDEKFDGSILHQSILSLCKNKISFIEIEKVLLFWHSPKTIREGIWKLIRQNKLKLNPGYIVELIKN